ncbi:MAG: iron ABC transporter permease [Muricomes sp.]
MGTKCGYCFVDSTFSKDFGCCFSGGSLSITGAHYQGVFQNPLVSDNILGVSAGAGFGAAMAIAMGLPGYFIGIFAFAGASAAVFITYSASHIFTGNPTLLLVLTGTVVSSLFSAFLSIIQFLVPPETKLPAIVFWLMGSFARLNMASLAIMAPIVIAGSILLFRLRWKLNILSLGDNMAHSLGINAGRTRLIIIALSTLISAVTVSYCGIVGWVGVVIPQVTRMAIGPDNRRLIPTSFFAGSLFMMFVDLICRTLTAAELPVGIITAIIGAPLYLMLLNRVRKGWL